MAQPELFAELCKPSPTPNPVSKDRIDEHRHEQRVQHERPPLPTFGHRARRDRRGGVHEDHRKEEEPKHTHVVRVAAEKETLRAEETEGVAGDRYRVLGGEWTSVTERGNSTDAAHLQSVAARSVTEQTDAI